MPAMKQSEHIDANRKGRPTFNSRRGQSQGNLVRANWKGPGKLGAIRAVGAGLASGDTLTRWPFAPFSDNCSILVRSEIVPIKKPPEGGFFGMPNLLRD